MSMRSDMLAMINERLKDFDVPAAVRQSLVDDLVAVATAPSKVKHGATVMTHEASLAADQERKHGASPNRAKPQVL